MKIVNGAISQYQLVDKTKQKDLDGVRYLVAGEKSLWVKILKDRSVSKRIEIEQLIERGISSGFEKPLEIIFDNKGFAGYTFEGPQMDVVPVREQKKETAPPLEKIGDKSAETVEKEAVILPKKVPSTGIQYLILVAVGAILFWLMLNGINDWIIRYIYFNISNAAGEGCDILSIHGILPAAVGVTGMILYHRILGKKISSVPIYAGVTVIAFIVGMTLAYALIGLLCAIVVGIFGVAKAYQSVIITIIVLLILLKLFFSKKR